MPSRRGIVELTRIVGPHEQPFVPVDVVGPVTRCVAEFYDDGGLGTVEVRFTEVQWGCLGTAGSMWVMEDPETVLERLEAARQG
jgi:hypothetical protein